MGGDDSIWTRDVDGSDRVAVESNEPIWDTLMVRSEVPLMGWIKEVIQREDSRCLSVGKAWEPPPRTP